MSSFQVFALVNGRILLTGKCIECGKNVDNVVDAQAYGQWRFGGMFIQNAFPEMSHDDREFLISGLCGKCFDKLFEGTEE
jgi:hypothetical protein